MKNAKITKDILIEDLVNNYAFSVRYMRINGIRCIACGDSTWGTLEEAAKEKNYSDADIDRFVEEMNILSAKE